MRVVVLFLVLLLLPPFSTVRAQDPELPPSPRPLTSALPITGTSAPPENTLDHFAASQPARVRWDREKGALYGFAIGGLVGGVGFAATNYAFTTSTPRDEYTLPSFVMGAAVGGATGAIVGAIIGVPERDETRPKQARLYFAPHLADGGALTVSVSLPSR